MNKNKTKPVSKSKLFLTALVAVVGALLPLVGVDYDVNVWLDGVSLQEALAFASAVLASAVVTRFLLGKLSVFGKTRGEGEPLAFVDRTPVPGHWETGGDLGDLDDSDEQACTRC